MFEDTHKKNLVLATENVNLYFYTCLRPKLEDELLTYSIVYLHPLLSTVTLLLALQSPTLAECTNSELACCPELTMDSTKGTHHNSGVCQSKRAAL